MYVHIPARVFEKGLTKKKPYIAGKSARHRTRIPNTYILQVNTKIIDFIAKSNQIQMKH